MSIGLFKQGVICVFLLVCTVGFVEAADKPNIVVFLTDDRGYGDLGCYGSDTLETPNIDRLCQQGMKFTDFYVHQRCSPTRLAFMTGSPQNNPSRRTALKSIGATTALAASGLLPSMTCAAPSASVSGKLRVGLIGAGNRAKWLTRALSRESDRAELVAVCDCYLPQIDVLAADNKNDPKAGAAWARYQDYEQMFEQEELDAVMIATPDHVRVRAAIIACVKGLDIYAEKPLSFSIPEGRALVQAVRKHKRILQVGTQQRSTANNQYSCEFVRSGGLGKVHTILVKNYSGSRPATGLEKQAIPEGMDWDQFCDQTPLLDYHEQLHRRWRNFDAFTGGPICDRGAHALDMVHLAMGWENVAPTRIEPTTDAKDVRQRGVRLYYPDGTVVRLESDNGPAFGGIFIGEKGKLEINRGRFAWITPKEDLTRNELMVNGKWNKLRVLAVGPQIQTWINGKQVADVADDEAFAKYPSGVIAQQVHGVKKSPEKVRHVSFRSIRVRRIESVN